VQEEVDQLSYSKGKGKGSVEPVQEYEIDLLSLYRNRKRIGGAYAGIVKNSLNLVRKKM
jgi:hypothetical protein